MHPLNNATYSRLFGVLLFTAVVCGAARADATEDTPCPNLYSPQRALALSGLGTGIGVGVGGVLGVIGFATWSPAMIMFGTLTTAVSLTVGPGAGHFHVGNRLQAWINMSLRAVFIVATAYFAALSMIPRQGAEEDVGEMEVSVLWPVLAGTGAALVLGLAVFDISTAKRAASRKNEQACKATSWKLAPALIRAHDRAGPGLVLGASF